MSSVVGPSPPVTISRSERAEASESRSRIGEPSGTVPCLPIRQPQREQFPRQPLEMGVADGPEEQFAAGVEKFDPHCSEPVRRPSQRSTIACCQCAPSTE